jgi:dsRNA-specific ribonuclease
MKAEQFTEKKEQLAGWPVRILSYKVGEKYHVTVHNEQPGAWVAKAEGATLQEAEQKAREAAGERLARTRRVS